jgi:hypothetical protein
MVGKYLSAGAASGSEWIAAGYLLFPFVVGSLFGGVFAFLMKLRGWSHNIISIAPISIMFGVLSYVVLMAIDLMVSGNFTPRAILGGVLIALVATWPIAFVMGPIFFIYIVQIKKGRKILKDRTVIIISILCLISEFAFLKVFLGDAE